MLVELLKQHSDLVVRKTFVLRISALGSRESPGANPFTVLFGVFYHCRAPDVITGQTDVRPTQWRKMGGKPVGEHGAVIFQPVDGAFQIDRIPRTIALNFVVTLLNFPQTIEEDRSGQRIPGFAFVQTRLTPVGDQLTRWRAGSFQSGRTKWQV